MNVIFTVYTLSNVSKCGVVWYLPISHRRSILQYGRVVTYLGIIVHRNIDRISHLSYIEKYIYKGVSTHQRQGLLPDVRGTNSAFMYYSTLCIWLSLIHI